MNALETLATKQNDTNTLLNEPENKDLIQALQNFALKLARYGFNVEVYSKASLLKLADVTSEKKASIRVFFENWSQWIEPDTVGTDIIEIDLEKDKIFLKRALDHYGLWMHDDFWKTLSRSQVIELYGSDMIQLYRNINFFKFCSYSLLDVSVFEWYNLWARPSVILEEMLRDATTAMTTPTPVMPYRVPRHVLNETKSAVGIEGSPSVACLVQFKSIGSLYRGLQRQPAGAIATSEPEVIAMGEKTSTIHFV